MKQNLRKLINYSIKKESKHLVLTLDELKEIQSADKRLRKLEKIISILKRFNFKINTTRHNNTGYEIWIDEIDNLELTQKEYDLLNEEFKYDKQN